MTFQEGHLIIRSATLLHRTAALSEAVTPDFWHSEHDVSGHCSEMQRERHAVLTSSLTLLESISLVRETLIKLLAFHVRV